MTTQPIGESIPMENSAGQDSPQPFRQSTPISGSVVGEDLGSSQRSVDTQAAFAAAEFLDLRIWAESFNDTQQHRIATINRMERGGVDGDLLAGYREMLEASEHAFKLAMVRAYRRAVRTHMPAVETWQKASFGIGEHLLARLLGHLGHPLVATPYVWMDEPPAGHECIAERCGKRHLVALQPFERSVGQLWQYCGHGAPSKRRKGMSQDEALGLGNPSCKFLVYLLAEATIKVTLPDTAGNPRPGHEAASTHDSAGGKSPLTTQVDVDTQDGLGGEWKYHYRRIYDTRKASTGDREWTDGHRHADALRIVGKEILRDLWTNAHIEFDTQKETGAGGHA